MEESDVYKLLGKMTEEMYLGLEKVKSSGMQDQLVQYHALAEREMGALIDKMSYCTAGEIMQKSERKIQTLKGDFSAIKNDIGSKYKIYLRGCGKAGKSTLLNALLSIDENVGSRMGRIPMTFTIDTYTDELTQNEAVVRKIDSKGKGNFLNISRNEAINLEAEEERKFFKSKEKCTELIKSAVKNVYLEQEREDIETDIYKQHLMKTTIREIKWGIGTNKFFHNCMLIDTPGLNQELRFTNVIEDIKNYEVDGIVWVISSDTLAKAEVIDAYETEFKEMKSIYADKKVVAVINMYGAGDEYKYGSKLWEKVEKKAYKIYCEKCGFSEIICVNAKLAYDGNLSRNQQQIDDSNISELRKKINEMFVERSSEEYHDTKLNGVNSGMESFMGRTVDSMLKFLGFQGSEFQTRSKKAIHEMFAERSPGGYYDKKLKKMDVFLDNFYKDVSEQHFIVQEKVKQYDKIRTAIEYKQSTYTARVKEDIAEKIDRYLVGIKIRMEENARRIKDIDNESKSARSSFLENHIIQTKELEKIIGVVLFRWEETVFLGFKEQQKQSVISDFRTKEYAFQNFQRQVGDMSLKENRCTIRISTPTDWGGQLLEKIDNFNVAGWVKQGAKRVVNAVRNFGESPQARIYEEISSAVRGWARGIGLNEEIDEYAEQCRQTLEKSMESTCGNYNDACDLCRFMENSIKNRPRMNWKKIGLHDIIGGTNDV